MIRDWLDTLLFRFGCFGFHRWHLAASRSSNWVGYGIPYKFCVICGEERPQ